MIAYHTDSRQNARDAEDCFITALKGKGVSLFNKNRGGGGTIGLKTEDETGKTLWIHNPDGYTIYLVGMQVEAGQQYDCWGKKMSRGPSAGQKRDRHDEGSSSSSSTPITRFFRAK